MPGGYCKTPFEHLPVSTSVGLTTLFEHRPFTAIHQQMPFLLLWTKFVGQPHRLKMTEHGLKRKRSLQEHFHLWIMWCLNQLNWF